MALSARTLRVIIISKMPLGLKAFSRTTQHDIQQSNTQHNDNLLNITEHYNSKDNGT